MRIGFDAKRAFNNHRGLGNYSRDILRIMGTMAPENQYYAFTPRIDPSIGFVCPDGMVLKTPGCRNRWVQDGWRTFGIPKAAKAVPLDLYHGLSHELPVGIEKTGIKTVVTMHDLMYLKHPEWFPLMDRWTFRWKYLRSCRIADKVVAISERTRDDLLELTDVDPGKAEVVYQGYHPEFRVRATEDQKQSLRERYRLPEAFLLNVAAIEPRKNQLLLLKALQDGKIDLPLVIAGRKTDYLKELQVQAEKARVQTQVIWLPDFPATELPILYQCATLFVFPSFYEGFGIPVVEALVSGLPVIAATGSCLEESGGPDSVYASPDDAQEWAERIRQLLDDPVSREKMIQRGLDYAQGFSDEAVCQHLSRIYKNLMP